MPISCAVNDIMIKGELHDALAPHTALACRIKGVIRGTVFNRGTSLMLKVTLNVGWEKSKLTFKKGEIAYDPVDEWLVIFLKDTQQGKKYNLIGQLDYTESLEKVRTGSSLEIRFS
jgi:hypothetical protein